MDKALRLPLDVMNYGRFLNRATAKGCGPNEYRLLTKQPVCEIKSATNAACGSAAALIPFRQRPLKSNTPEVIMNTKIQKLLLTLAFLGLTTVVYSQSSAFTYQGVLTDQAGRAN